MFSCETRAVTFASTRNRSVKRFERAGEELDRDAAAELGVAREEHLPHAAAAELADQLVLLDAQTRSELELIDRRRLVATRRGCRIDQRAGPSGPAARIFDVGGAHRWLLY
jgi:hypothetical protein